MSTIEVLLKLGISIVAWMVIYAHCIWAATLGVAGCDADGDALWLLLLIFAPFTLGFSFSLSASTQLPEVHGIIKYLALPLVVLIPLAALPVWTTMQIATIGTAAICGDGAQASWHAWWAPVQIFTLLTVTVMAWRAWTAGSEAGA